jgi:hypothetical protein
MKCPVCDGAKSLRPIHVKQTVGRGIRVHGNAITCPRCEGVGELPDQMAAWIRDGERLRSQREEAMIGLREAADMMAMKASELSAIESGRVDPATFVPPDTMRHVYGEGGFRQLKA